MSTPPYRKGGAYGGGKDPLPALFKFANAIQQNTSGPTVILIVVKQSLLNGRVLVSTPTVKPLD